MTLDNALNDYFDENGAPLELPAGTFAKTTTVMQILQEELTNPPPSIPNTVPFDDFVNAFLNWNERTSTSPSGRHLGLYNSVVTAHCDSGSEFDDAHTHTDPSTKLKATYILHAMHSIATSVAERGLYLARWIHVVNVMIYRKAFERWTIHNAVTTKRLHPSQFGKKGGECMDAAVAKVLHNTAATLTKTPMRQFESDATPCFDIIIMTFAMLCFFLYGCPSHFIRFWYGVLTHHNHQVKTAFGISHGSYSYEASLLVP
jgi:hypothetical protein